MRFLVVMLTLLFLVLSHTAHVAAQEKPAATPKAEVEMEPGKIFRDCPDCPEMVVIQAGSFDMGSRDGDGSKKPVYRMKSFALGKYEVTQGEWRAIMGSNPPELKFTNCGDTCPVENVSWDDTQEFIQKLNQKTGKQYRLPTEGEWEYACYGGSQSEYCGGGNLDALGWYKDNSGGQTHPVGQKRANGYGLYDMSGNVWEWTSDLYCCSHDWRALRGGSWRNAPQFARAASRKNSNRRSGTSRFGFRLARTLP